MLLHSPSEPLHTQTRQQFDGNTDIDETGTELLSTEAVASISLTLTVYVWVSNTEV